MAKTGRNELCPCGSGKKYKNCHESKTSSSRTSRILMLVVGAAVIAAIAAGVSTFSGERNRSAVRVWDPAHGHYHDANGVQVP
jgi:SEC-C motif